MSFSPVMSFSHCKWFMKRTLMWFYAFLINWGKLNRIILVFNVSYFSIKFSFVDSWSSFKLKCLIEFRIVVGWNYRFICYSKKVRISCFPIDCIKRWKFRVTTNFIDSDWYWSVISLSLGFLEWFDSLTALILLTCLR